MALKLPDSAVPMGDFPVAKAVDIDFDDGENLQEKLDNGALGGDNSTHKTVIFENNIDMGKYLLLAKITNANYSNNIIKFSCPNYKGVNDTGFKYENDMDIYKFELHFNTGSRRENNGYGVTLKQHGLGLYSYPLNNPQNTSPKIEEAIRLYWDYSNGDIYVFLVDLMTAIPHCVLEYTGSGTLIRNNTFVNDDLYNRRDGLNGTWEDSKWSSISYNKLETPPIYELGGDGGSAGGTTTYTSLSQLGLTADATIDDVIVALKDGETALISTNEFTNYLTMFPNQCANDQYAVIKVEKEGVNKVFLEWRQKEGGAYAIGGLSNRNNFTNWNNLVRFKKDGFADDSIVCIGDTTSNDGVVQTLESLGFSNNILSWDTGVYRVSHVGGLTNLPSDIKYEKPGFRLEHHNLKKWGGNHNPNIETWGLRHSILYAEDGGIYHRYTESGVTAGVYTKDTGWQKISKTVIIDKLADLGLTAPCTTAQVANALKGIKPQNNVAIAIIDIAPGQVTDAPYDYGLLHIETIGYDRISVRFEGVGSSSYKGSWIGQIQGSSGTFNSVTWSRIDIENRVDELFQSVSSGKTLVANAITGKGVSTATDATFATMATNISKISGGYKEETKSLIVTSNSTGTQTLTFTFSANVIAVKQIVAPSDNCRIVPQTSKDMLTINGKELIVYVTGTGTWKATALVRSS